MNVWTYIVYGFVGLMLIMLVREFVKLIVFVIHNLTSKSSKTKTKK